MRTILEEEQELPEGLWLIKWLDCISLGSGRLSSPRIHLILQRLKQDSLSAISRLSLEDTSYLIGRRPNQPQEEVPHWATPRQVLTGILPLLKVGDIVRGRRVEGSLRQRDLTLSIDHRSDVRPVGIFESCQGPKDWSGKFRALNRFEYELGTHRESSGSRCLRIRNGKVEYLIPDTVILRTFYGFHTKLANAICSGPWDTKYPEVISTLQYESGIGTYVNPQSGAWNIVVQRGLTRDHAVRLALLYFDAFARKCANAIYANALRQTYPVRNDGDRHWFVHASIPYQWDAQPLQMRIKALQLRPYRPSSPDGLRFLVTSIDATSWPFPDQEIFSELSNSCKLGQDHQPKKVDRPYHRSKAQPVVADPDAELDHHSDAYKNASDNLVDAGDFSFLNSPRHSLQPKVTHKEYQSSSKAPEANASLLLSAGNLAPGEEKPAPLIAESRDRRMAPQLQLLLSALDELLDDGDIAAFHTLEPPESSHLRQMRNGVACWSFASEKQMRDWRARRPVSGWEFIFEPPLAEGGPKRAHPRCLLVVCLQFAGRDLLLFEVEPRVSEQAYRFYIAEVPETVSLAAIETALIVLQAHSGRLPASALSMAFRSLTNNKVVVSKHRYIRNTQQEIIALETGSLLRAITRVLS